MSILDLLAKGGRAATRAAPAIGRGLGMGALNAGMGGMLSTIYADDPALSDEQKMQLILRAALISGAGGGLGFGLTNSILPAGLSMFASGPLARMSLDGEEPSPQPQAGY